MQTLLRRTLWMLAAFTLAATLLTSPAHARSKKKGGADSTRTATAAAPAAKTPARDAKGHFVKTGAAPAAAAAPAAVAPAAAPAARTMPARDAKGHFMKGGSTAAAPAAVASTSTPAAVAPASNLPARDAKGHFIKSGTTAPAAAAPNAMPAAAPNGPNTVWVNLDSKIYHKPGTRWYGKTKHGQYMSEADAQRAGYRAEK